MFRSIAVRKDPATGAGALDVAWVIDAVGAVGLVVVLITVSVASPGPATHDPRGTAIAVTLGAVRRRLDRLAAGRPQPRVMYARPVR